MPPYGRQRRCTSRRAGGVARAVGRRGWGGRCRGFAAVWAAKRWHLAAGRRGGSRCRPSGLGREVPGVCRRMGGKAVAPRGGPAGWRAPSAVGGGAGGAGRLPPYGRQSGGTSRRAGGVARAVGRRGWGGRCRVFAAVWAAKRWHLATGRRRNDDGPPGAGRRAMRMRGLEPPRARSPQAPEACASTNSATSARSLTLAIARAGPTLARPHLGLTHRRAVPGRPLLRSTPSCRHRLGD